MKKNTTTFNVKFYGLDLEVEGYYYLGEQETRDNPSSPDLFEIHQVLVNGLYDITEILENSYNNENRKVCRKTKIEELEELIINKYV